MKKLSIINKIAFKISIIIISIIFLISLYKCGVENQLIVYQPFYSKIIQIGIEAESEQKHLIDNVAYTKISYNTYTSDSVLLYYSEIVPYGKYIEIKRPRFLYADDIYNLELVSAKISNNYFKEELPGKIIYYEIETYDKHYFIKINVINDGTKNNKYPWE